MDARVAKLIVNRLGFGVLTLFIVSLVVFTLTVLLPGDAAQAALGQAATPEAVAALRTKMGLDVLPHLRYMHWLGGMLTGDFGYSLVNNTPVNDLLASRLPMSLMLGAATAAVSIPLALVLGIVSAMKRGSLIDRALNLGTLSVVAVPEFLVATIAVLVFAVKLRWLSALSFASDVDSVGSFLRAYALPVMTLCCVITAQMARMTRAALVDQLGSPYVEMAILKGAKPTRVVLTHALPNAIGPIANAIAFALSYLLSGVVIVETIFNYPGVASMMVDAVANRDIPLVQSCAMIFSTAYLVMVLLADLTAILSNPRLRHG